MSKIAIISDIHGNLEALQRILKDLEKQGATEIICLGDQIVKYYKPKECIDIIRANTRLQLLGNCDYNVANNPNFKWAREKIGIEGIDYFQNLPTLVQENWNGVKVNLFHATPTSITNQYNPINGSKSYAGGVVSDYRDMFIGDEPQISICGHTHIEFIGIEDNNEITTIHGGENGKHIDVDGDKRIIINVGSIGEPNRMRSDGAANIITTVPYAIVDTCPTNGHKLTIDMHYVKCSDIMLSVYNDTIENTINGNYPNLPETYLRLLRSLNKSRHLTEEDKRIATDTLKSISGDANYYINRLKAMRYSDEAIEKLLNDTLFYKEIPDEVFSEYQGVRKR